jgi:glycosyltransferase involved in cell wall biosynthesis
MKVAIVGGRDGTAPELAVDGYVDELAAALSARGEEVTLYTRRDGRHGRSDRGYDVAEVRVGPAKPFTGSDALSIIGDVAKSLDSMWSTNPPHVVHAHGWVSGLAAQLAARHRHLPVVQSFHGLAGPDDDSERRRLEPLLAKSATWVAAGHSEELGVLCRVRHSRERISVMPCGVDVERFTPVGPVPPRKLPHRVLFIGSNMFCHNAFDAIIRAIHWIPETELLIAGCDRSDQQAKAAVGSLAGEMGVGDRVRWLGVVRNGEFPALMRSADVVVWTPDSAPTASVALQAMASGVAVVATGVGAIADTVVHGVTGLLVTPGRPRELVGALKTLHAQDFRRQGMGAAGRARVRSRYTWDRIAADAQVIYHRIAVAARSDDIAPAMGESR